jgi:predicted nuclease of predicted toxin-antitoxin system
MLFLLDQGLPRSTVAALNELGHDAEHVGNLGMSKATDQAILDAARQRNAVVVTFDADFHTLLALTRASFPSVVRIRIEGLKGDDVAALIARVVAAAAAELQGGAAVSVTTSAIRVRVLPMP